MFDIQIKIFLVITWLLLALIILKIIFFFIIKLYSVNIDKFSNNNTTIDNYFLPKIDIIIAAYNEEKVIIDTVKNILNIDYEYFKIYIVNDGSTDSTLCLLEKYFNNNNKIKILSKINNGKAEALNYALSYATAELIVFLDADTHVKPNILKIISSCFENNNISAIAGHLQVRNNFNLMTYCQNMEYLSILNFEREVFDKIGTITTIPGAICAFRKEELLKIGGFKNKTLTEDCDVTIKFLKYELKIKNEKELIGYTEAPYSVRMFLRQRIRWNYGLIQNLLNHSSHLITNRPLDSNYFKLWLIFFYSWMYKVLYILIFSFADYFLLVTIIFGIKSFHYYYFFLLFIETVITILVLKKDFKVYAFPFYRIIYRHLSFFSLLIAIYKLVFRKKLSWIKIRRYNW